MHPIARGLLPAALSLSVLSFVALATQPTPAQPVTAAPAGTTTSTGPATTTTAAAPAPRLVTNPSAPSATNPSNVRVAPPTTAAPSPTPAAQPITPQPMRTHTGRESCGWQWDALRIDDGSSNEVTLYLDAPRRPNETVTIVAAFAGPDSPDGVRTTTTDATGQASAAKFTVSEDKRDWTITISASFAAGGACPAETFALEY